MGEESVSTKNAEVFLRGRRNAYETRLAKQQLMLHSKKKRRGGRKRFVRAESMVANRLATEREKERVKRISRSINKGIDGKILDETKNGAKIRFDGRPRLLFVVRIKGPYDANISQKASKILQVLRLGRMNTGVFLKLNTSTLGLLRIVAPYIVVGEPSLSTIRSLIQRRSRIELNGHEINLNDNNIVEEELGERGIICMEDIVHEISTMGESFKECCFFLLPFQLARQVRGFSALRKLKKLEQRQKVKPRSNASDAPLVEIDMDRLLNELN